MAVYTMTVIGWRVCWRQRYCPLISENDQSGSDDSTEIDDLQVSNPSIGDTPHTNVGETNTATPKVI